jgi:hypothetical protein
VGDDAYVGAGTTVTRACRPARWAWPRRSATWEGWTARKRELAAAAAPPRTAEGREDAEAVAGEGARARGGKRTPAARRARARRRR